MSELQNFIRASNGVVEFQAYFSSIPDSDHTIHSLEVHRGEIVHLWSTLRNAYDKVLIKHKSSGKEGEGQDKDDELESIKTKYYAAFNAHLNANWHGII